MADQPKIPMYPMPNVFSYQGMICTCLNINYPTMDSMLLELTPMDPKYDLEMVMQKILNDPVFGLYITQYYGLTIQRMETRCQINEDTNDAHYYLFCKTIQSDAALKTYETGISLFVDTIGRISNTLFNTEIPFLLHKVKDHSNPDSEEVDLNGITTMRVIQSTSSKNYQRYIHPYGVITQTTVCNFGSIRKVFPQYRVLEHDNIYNESYNAIETAAGFLQRYLSPCHLMNIHFECIHMADNFPGSINSMGFRSVIHANTFNGVEVYDTEPFSMTFCPPHWPEVDANSLAYNWTKIYPFYAQISMALLSDVGVLFEPYVVNHEVEIINGRRWLKLFFEPHFIPFTADMTFYGNEDAINGFGRGKFWTQSTLAIGLQFSFPLVGEHADPHIVAYGRMDAKYIGNAAALTAICTYVTCKEITMRFCAESAQWIYFALVDETSIDRDELPLIDTAFLPTVIKSSDTQLSQVLNFLIGAFSTCPGVPIMSEQIRRENKDKHVRGKDLMDVEREVFACWERGSHMLTRSWAATYIDEREKAMTQAASKIYGEQSVPEEPIPTTAPSPKTQPVQHSSPKRKGLFNWLLNDEES